MKNLSKVSVLSLMFAFLFTVVIGSFTDSQAGERRKRWNPTKSGIQDTLGARKEKALTNWDSLSPEQQAYYEEKAKARAGKAKMTSQEYWNSLSPEEQQEAMERSRARATKGRKRWQSLPE